MGALHTGVLGGHQDQRALLPGECNATHTPPPPSHSLEQRSVCTLGLDKQALSLQGYRDLLVPCLELDAGVIQPLHEGASSHWRTPHTDGPAGAAPSCATVHVKHETQLCCPSGHQAACTKVLGVSLQEAAGERPQGGHRIKLHGSGSRRHHRTCCGGRLRWHWEPQSHEGRGAILTISVTTVGHTVDQGRGGHSASRRGGEISSSRKLRRATNYHTCYCGHNRV